MYYHVLGEAVLTAGDLPPEAQLKEALLEHYDASVRPTYNTTEATRVVMDLALQQIIDVVGISSFFSTMYIYPTGRKFALEFNFCYFASAKFAKFNLCLILAFHKLCDDSLYE